jgi:hypothetical protein
MRSVVAAILLCRCLAAQAPASLSGTVIDATTKQPVAGVHISLIPVRAAMADGASDSRPAIYGAMSTSDGRFSVTGMPPSAYFLIPDRTGYVFVPDKPGVVGMQQSLVLKPGENKTDFVVLMTPRAVILGRVTDEFGDPVQNASIQAVLQNPKRALSIGNNLYANTDDQGQFRLHGAPGKYLVSADAPQTQRFAATKEVRTDGSQPSSHSTTWYPSVDRKDHATVVEALAGRDTTGIEIRLISRRSVSISGVVSGWPAGPQMPTVRIWSDEGDGGGQAVRNMRAMGLNQEGKFEMSGLAPGQYHLLAQYNAPPDTHAANMQSQVVDVRAESGDFSGIQLTLAPGGEITGIVEIPEPASNNKRTVTLEVVSGVQQRIGQDLSASVGNDGSFHLNSIFPGRYSVKVDPMPEGAYLKSIRLDNTEQPDPIVDLTHGSGSSKLKVSLSLNAATLTGSIVDDKGEPSENPFVFVVLARTPEDVGRELTRVAGSGTYTFKGIAPGKYRLFAVDVTLLSGGDLENLKPLFEKGEAIEIHEGDRITKNAKLPPPDKNDK